MKDRHRVDVALYAIQNDRVVQATYVFLGSGTCTHDSARLVNKQKRASRDFQAPDDLVTIILRRIDFYAQVLPRVSSCRALRGTSSQRISRYLAGEARRRRSRCLLVGVEAPSAR
jgi:hypothetical protein